MRMRDILIEEMEKIEKHLAKCWIGFMDLDPEDRGEIIMHILEEKLRRLK